ncbi:MAG: glycosyltransferase [Candidatus Omnitrophota bacterium]|nr:glycosyltransferase [Candidatus Omnitrophota bacterium]
MKTLNVRIVILNYNGRQLLGQCLPSVVEAARRASHRTAVTVLDNCSADDGPEFVRLEFPSVDVVAAPENKVLCSYNDYLANIDDDVVILLNNDIRVDENFVDPLVNRFASDGSTFLVAPRVMTFDGKSVEAGRSKGGVRWGLFWCSARYPGYEDDLNQPGETFSSGFGAFSRKRFVELGGYDERYLPGILEDVDLCLRASRKGWGLYYEPLSIVYHVGQASFKREFGSRKMAVMASRNTFLFMWKNYNGLRFWATHIFLLPLRLVFALMRGNSALLAGFFAAVTMRKKL